MGNTEHEQLLRSARSLLDRFMFEGDELRDDVANLCMKINASKSEAPSRRSPSPEQPRRRWRPPTPASMFGKYAIGRWLGDPE